MGLEAVCNCRIDDTAADAKVLLEAAELILRAPFRRTFRRAGLADVEVVGDDLRLRSGASVIVLRLGAAVAAKWAGKILAPAPSLGRKLGIGHASPAFVIGAVEEPALVEALAGHTADAGSAKLGLAVVGDAAQLDAALAAHRALEPGSPLWIVYGKGAGAPFGEAAVRQHMRRQGYRDTKVSAVSAGLSATRYSRGRTNGK